MSQREGEKGCEILSQGFPLKAKEKAEARREDLRKDKKGKKRMKNKIKRIEEEMQATIDYIAQLEIELGEMSLTSLTEIFETKRINLEKKISNEYAYYNGLNYALFLIKEKKSRF